MRILSHGLLLACVLFSLLGVVAQDLPDAQLTNLVTQLASTDTVMRKDALVSAGYYHDARLFPAVKALLADDNPLIRAAAAQAAANCGGPQATSLITPLLNDEFLSVRVAAMAALGATRDPRAIPTLLTCARDPKAEARTQAISGLGTLLGELGEQREVVEQLLPALFQLENDAAPAISQQAEKELWALCYKVPSSAALQDAAIELLNVNDAERSFPRSWAGNYLYFCNAPRVVPALIDIIRDHPTTWAVYSASTTIYQIMNTRMQGQDNALLDPLRQMISATDNRESCLRAMATLARLHDRQSVDQLLLMVKEKRPFYINAMDALLDIDDPRAFPTLCALYRDADAEVRRSSADALCKVGDAASLERLLTMVSDSEMHVRLTVASALRYFHGPRVSTALLLLAHDKRLDVRRMALLSLTGMHGKAVVLCARKALTDADPYLQRNAIAVLGASGDPSAAAALAPMLHTKDAKARRAALLALIRLGDARGFAALQATFAAKGMSEDDYITALGNARGSGAVDAAINGIQGRINDQQNPILGRYIGLVIPSGAAGIKRLNTLLADPRPSVRLSAAYVCKCLADARNLPALLPLLADPDARISNMAAEALGQVGDARAIPPLLAALQKADSAQSATILHQLGLIGDPSVVPTLVTALADRDLTVRQGAAEGLSTCADARAVPALTVSVKDGDIYLRQVSVTMLAKFNDDAAIDAEISALHDSNEYVVEDAVNALCTNGSPRALNGLLQEITQLGAENTTAFKDTKSVIEGYVTYNLAWTNGGGEPVPGIYRPEAQEFWLATVHEKNAVMRALAIVVLDQGRHPRIAEIALAGLSDTDATVRAVSALALGDARAARAIPPLLTALHDPELTVRLAAATALGQIGDTQAVPALRQLLAALPTRDANSRICLAAALSHFGDAQAIAALNELLYVKGQNRYVILNAVQALGKFHLPQVTDLLFAAMANSPNNDWFMPAESLQALSSVGDRRAVDRLLAMADAAPTTNLVPYTLCTTLGALGDTRALDPLLRILHCARWDYHAGAAMGLGRLQDPRAVPALLAALDDGSSIYLHFGEERGLGQDYLMSSTREQAALALGEIGDRRAVPALITALGWGDMGSRAAVVIALGKLKDPRSIAPLIAVLPQLSGNARPAAAAALTRLSGVEYGTDAAKWQGWLAARAKRSEQ